MDLVKYSNWLRNFVRHKYGLIIEPKRTRRQIRDNYIYEVEISFPTKIDCFLSFRDGRYVYFDFRDNLTEDQKGLENFLGKGEIINEIVSEEVRKSARRRLRMHRKLSNSPSEIVYEILKAGSPEEILFSEITNYIILPVIKNYRKHHTQH